MTTRSTPDVKSIFGQALEIEDAGRRAAYLAEACANAPAVRAEVEDLLKVHGNAGSFMRRPAATPSAST